MFVVEISEFKGLRGTNKTINSLLDSEPENSIYLQIVCSVTSVSFFWLLPLIDMRGTYLFRRVELRRGTICNGSRAASDVGHR